MQCNNRIRLKESPRARLDVTKSPADISTEWWWWCFSSPSSCHHQLAVQMTLDFTRYFVFMYVCNEKVSSWFSRCQSCFAIFTTSALNFLPVNISGLSYTPTQLLNAPTQLSYTLTQLLNAPTQLSYTPTQLLNAPPQLSYTPTQLFNAPTQLSYTLTQLLNAPTELSYAPTQLQLCTNHWLLCEGSHLIQLYKYLQLLEWYRWRDVIVQST